MAGAPTKKAMSACIQVTRAVRKVCNGVASSEHKLWIANDLVSGGVILFCSRCQGYTTGRARRLAHGCEPTNARRGAGPTAGRRFWSRLHPQHRGRLTDLKRLDQPVAHWMAGRVEHDTPDCPVATEAVVDGAGQPLASSPASSNTVAVEPAFDYVPSEVSDCDDDIFGCGFGFDEP